VQRNVENRPNYESIVHNMTFKPNKMSLLLLISKYARDP